MRKNKAKAMLDALKEPARLSTNKGRIVGDKCKRKPNKKTRRHSGRYTPWFKNDSEKYSEMIENAEEPQESYDDWIERRDGLRYDGDSTHLRSERMNWDAEELKKENKRVIKRINVRKSKQKRNQDKKNINNYVKKKDNLAKRMHKMWKTIYGNR